MDSKWWWLRESPNYWSLTKKPGYLRIYNLKGELYRKQNNAKNVLLQKAPKGDFTLLTRVNFNPSKNWQQAALLIYQDDDNYVGTKFIYDNEKQVQLCKEVEGKILLFLQNS